MPKKMLAAAQFAFCVIFFTFVNVYGKQLPPHFKTCSRSDKNFEECLKVNVADAFALLASGNKEFGILPLDPMHFKEVVMEPIPGPINLLQKYINSYLIGISKIKITDLIVDFDKCSLYFNAVAPDFKAEADYEFKGQLMVFPIDAKGHFLSIHKNFKITSNVTCEIYKKNNLEYLRLLDSKVWLAPKELSFELGDIIPGNKQLNDEIHKLINDDPLAFFEIIRPTANRLFSEIFSDTANKIFSQVPMRDIFKD